MNHLLDIGPKVGVLTVFLEDEDIFGNEASSVLSETLDPALASYRPKTRKTAAAYEKLLAFVQRRVGEVPADILRSAAEEVLSNMQNINLTGPDKRGNVLGVLGINTITNAEFGELVGISSQITDFDAAGGTGEFVGPTPNSNKEIDEESGVALLFDDDEDDNNMQSMGADDGIIGEIAEDNDAYEDRQGGGGAEETFRRRGVTLSGGREQSNEDMEPDEMILNVVDIDAHWLQRELSTYYKDKPCTISSVFLISQTLLLLLLCSLFPEFFQHCLNFYRTTMCNPVSH